MRKNYIVRMTEQKDGVQVDDKRIIAALYPQAAVLDVFRAYVEEIRDKYEQMGDWTVSEWQTKSGDFRVQVNFSKHNIRTVISAGEGA